jgi:hypothetical protein
MALKDMLGETAKQTALKKLKGKMKEEAVGKIIDPAIQKTGFGKKAVFGGGIAALIIAAVEYFL